MVRFVPDRPSVYQLEREFASAKARTRCPTTSILAVLLPTSLLLISALILFYQCPGNETWKVHMQNYTIPLTDIVAMTILTDGDLYIMAMDDPEYNLNVQETITYFGKLQTTTTSTQNTHVLPDVSGQRLTLDLKHRRRGLILPSCTESQLTVLIPKTALMFLNTYIEAKDAHIETINTCYFEFHGSRLDIKKLRSNEAHINADITTLVDTVVHYQQCDHLFPGASKQLSVERGDVSINNLIKGSVLKQDVDHSFINVTTAWTGLVSLSSVTPIVSNTEGVSWTKTIDTEYKGWIEEYFPYEIDVNAYSIEFVHKSS
ncbi:hypothetical protein P9112_002774 [Eukaryota sp. TZLM1-RC]